MTGGHGALPYFNAFMNEFMKDKEKEKFPDAPPIPADIKSSVERSKREELEKLEKADEGTKTGIVFTPERETEARPTRPSLAKVRRI